MRKHSSERLSNLPKVTAAVSWWSLSRSRIAPGCGRDPGLERGLLGGAALRLVHRSACAGVFCGAPVSTAKLETGTGGIRPFTGFRVDFRALAPGLKQSI